MKGFQINTEITLEEGLREVLFGRISYIEEQVHDPEDIHRAIHETRRSIKRIRAILRMVRDEIGYSHYYRENLFYRDLARRMAPVRDSFVLLQTFDSLQTQDRRILPAGTRNAVKHHLSMRIQRDLNRFIDSRGGFDRIFRDLQHGRERIAHFCHLRNRFIAIRKGIRRIYSKGRRQEARIRKAFDPEIFHEYRKNSKYLQFQMELLQPLYPRLLKAYAGTLDRHTELLGEIRDFNRLEHFLQVTQPVRLTVNDARKISERFRNSRMEMLSRALFKSQMIYAEKPGELINRIRIYWKHRYPLN